MPWWPDDVWERMCAGVDCAMCGDAHLPHNEFGDLIVATEWSYLRLGANQTHAGYCVAIARRHASELHHLTADERRGLWDDVARLDQAIAEVLQPVKLAHLSMGFRIPHVHCHVVPQHREDDPFGPIDPQAGDVRLAPDAWAERLAALRSRFLALGDEVP